MKSHVGLLTENSHRRGLSATTLALYVEWASVIYWATACETVGHPLQSLINGRFISGLHAGL